MMRILQSGSGDTRPLVILYLVGPHLDDAIRAALGPDPCIVAYAEAKPAEGLDAAVAAAQQRAHFSKVGGLVLGGYSLGCTGVRARLLEEASALESLTALVLIDGTHASKPAAPWQIDVWRGPFDRARAGEILVVATHTAQTYMEHLTPAASALHSTAAVLRRVTGWKLDEAGPLASPAQHREKQLFVYSYESADIDAQAHIQQQRTALPDMLARHVRAWLDRPEARALMPAPLDDAGPVEFGAAALATVERALAAGAQPAGTPQVHHLIRRGARGPDVAAWQRVLGIDADGIFGPETDAVTRQWQRAHHLVADGIVGPATWNAALTPAAGSSHEVTRAATPLTEADLAAVLEYAHQLSAGESPSRSRLACAFAHVALENGRGTAIWNDNLGNISGFGAWKGSYYVIRVAERVSKNPDVWKQIDMRFRAHGNPIAGAVDYWTIMTGRYAPVLAYFDAGDPEGAARELSRLGYFTARVDPYARAMGSIYRSFMASAPSAAVAPPPEIPREIPREIPAEHTDGATTETRGTRPSAGAAQRVDRALLIGVDKYTFISPNLEGCVRDVKDITAFLTKTLKTDPARIVALTSSRGGGEAPDHKATRDNIVNAFMRLGDAAQQGEQIYIQFSGHGMRNDTTVFPGLEADGRDEAIAPADSGYKDPAKPYILDKELGWLLRRITDKGAFVTMVMDCCHSATGTRDTVLSRSGKRLPEDGIGPRGWEGGDPRPRTDANLVAPLSELRAVVAAPDGQSGSLFPGPQGYVLMTACREQETAKEHSGNGVFTHFLCKVLNGGVADLTYRALLDRVASSILKLASELSPYRDQVPQLEGDGDLIVFGGGRRAEPRTMLATPVNDGTLLVSDGGSAVGTTVGTTLALYPPGAASVVDPAAEIGLATVIRVAADAATARAEDIPARKLVPAMRAVVVQPGTAKVRRRVGIASGDALERLKVAIAVAGRDDKPSPYIEIVAPDDRPELIVDVRDGAFVILDRDEAPLPRMAPVGVSEIGAAMKVARRIEHAARYLNAWDLRNKEASVLRDRLAISTTETRGAGRVSLRPGDSVRIEVHNRSKGPVSAALLYFSPDWSIERLWPDGSHYTELAPTGERGLEIVTLDASLPAGITRSLERIKLFATAKPTSFDALTLPSLDDTRTIGRALATSPLEQLLSDIDQGRSARELTRRPGAGEWGTAELELETTA